MKDNTPLRLQDLKKVRECECRQKFDVNVIFMGLNPNLLVNTADESMNMDIGSWAVKEDKIMKFLVWLCKVVLTVVLVSTLTVFTSGWVVNAYLKSMLASFNIQLPGQPIALVGMLQGMMGTAAKDTEDTKDSEEMTEKGGTSSEPGAVQAPSDEEPPVDALPVMGQTITEEAAGAGQQDQQVVVTPDEMVRKKDGLIASDKEEIFNILMTKLPQEKIQEITVAMENGLTEQELAEVEKVLSEYLDKDEYAKLLSLLKS
ncbi:hypothetical protein ACP8HI_22675 [Paenibacillus sp. FA6]|uniref:hypothetical protein n=1 Tax=Paenibacillus sp. FA6 TaxID=3413029 RepID=UPI003F65A116